MNMFVHDKCSLVCKEWNAYIFDDYFEEHAPSYLIERMSNFPSMDDYIAMNMFSHDKSSLVCKEWCV